MPDFESMSMKASDGETIRGRWWPGAGRGAVLYFHGIQSHGGWFERSAGYLAEQGLAVLLPDRRGSGVNRRKLPGRGVQKRLVADVSEQIDWLIEWAKVPAVYLVGVSWGAKLAVASYLRCHDRVAGIGLVGPGLFPKIDVATSAKVRIGLAAAVRPGAGFPIPLDDPALFTTNAEKQAYIRDDPLRLRSAPASFFAASRFMDRAKDRLAEMPACALTVFLAEHDAIVDNERIRTWVRQLGWAGVRVIQYDGTSHTLEFEANPSMYYSDLSAAALVSFGQATPQSTKSEVGG